MKKAVTLAILVCVISLVTVTTVPDTRGMMRVKTSEGNTIQLYSGSHALVIGNGDYRKGWDKLKGAVSDAKEVTEALKKHGFQVTLETNVTKDEFDRAFGQFAVDYGREKDNRLLFYYAGHGHTEKMTTGDELGYIVMVDTPTPEADPVEFGIKSVDMVSLVTKAKMIRANHVLFMFDSCFSGSIMNLRNKPAPESISNSVRYPVRQFITAGSENEPVPDYSVFKQAFLDLIEGRDKEPYIDGYITGEELGYYLKHKVPEYNPNQHPQYGKIRDINLDKGDFVFQLPKPPVPPPPPDGDFDIGDLTEEADRMEADRAVRIAWASQLKKMEAAFSEATAYEKRDVTPNLKIAVWQRFLEVFAKDDPYSQEDDQMKQKASQQITHWKAEKERTVEIPSPPITRPSLPDSDTIVGEDGVEMVLIPAGAFEMGTDSSEVLQLVQWAKKKWYSNVFPVSAYSFEDETPRHTVYLDAFYIDKYEVTNELYGKFMDATGHKAPKYWDDDKHNAPNQPVVGVSWDDAKAYAKWAGKRLPTEAEWEKAARGGLVGKKFPWGDEDPDADGNYRANYHPGDDIAADGFRYTAPVGSFAPNSYGLYDVAGNVWEWCADWYDKSYYANSPDRNPTGANTGTGRVLRGGMWFSRVSDFRAAKRGSVTPTLTASALGFRCLSAQD